MGSIFSVNISCVLLHLPPNPQPPRLPYQHHTPRQRPQVGGEKPPGHGIDQQNLHRQHLRHQPDRGDFGDAGGAGGGGEVDQEEVQDLQAEEGGGLDRLLQRPGDDVADKEFVEEERQGGDDRQEQGAFFDAQDLAEIAAETGAALAQFLQPPLFQPVQPAETGWDHPGEQTNHPGALAGKDQQKKHRRGDGAHHPEGSLDRVDDVGAEKPRWQGQHGEQAGCLEEDQGGGEINGGNQHALRDFGSAAPQYVELRRTPAGLERGGRAHEHVGPVGAHVVPEGDLRQYLPVEEQPVAQAAEEGVEQAQWDQ